MADEEKGGVVSYISVPDIPSKELSKKIEAIWMRTFLPSATISHDRNPFIREVL